MWFWYVLSFCWMVIAITASYAKFIGADGFEKIIMLGCVISIVSYMLARFWRNIHVNKLDKTHEKFEPRRPRKSSGRVGKTRTKGKPEEKTKED